MSKLVSNALATNKYTLRQQQPNKEEEERFIPLNEQKVLKNNILKPDLVVAQDGSGNFRTVQEAVDAACERQSKRENIRLVIYVKAGIYEENVDIGWYGKNITMVGDGIGKTIVTGNESVEGTNSTTYKSATFGTCLPLLA